MADKITSDDFELLGRLGVDTKPEPVKTHTPKEERVIAGFEEIQNFVEKQGQLPQHGEDRDIFERLYAVRLDRLRKSSEYRGLLKDFDTTGILNLEDGKGFVVAQSPDLSSDKALLEALGVSEALSSDITDLKHVKPRATIQVAEEIAQRTPCVDFHIFKPLFEQIQKELESGIRKTLKYENYAQVKVGDCFILDGQKLYVAILGDKFVNQNGKPDRRLRVIYDNGTESGILLRSLQRALNKDQTSRRVTDPSFGPLFSSDESAEDLPVGYIYVLRSNSKLPFIVEHRDVIHKIGVTGGSVEKRIANAEKDPTYLLASIEIVGTYKLSNLNRTRLENLIHRFFEKARLDLELKDRFGSSVEPREWFLVPLPAIEEAIQHIMDGDIGDFRYDPSSGRIA